jgi:hypothetical protein
MINRCHDGRASCPGGPKHPPERKPQIYLPLLGKADMRVDRVAEDQHHSGDGNDHIKKLQRAQRLPENAESDEALVTTPSIMKVGPTVESRRRASEIKYRSAQAIYRVRVTYNIGVLAIASARSSKLSVDRIFLHFGGQT